MRVANLFEEGFKGFFATCGDLDANQDLTVVGALIAVMEQTDVPIGFHGVQKTHQGTGPLGEFETIEQFIARKAGAPPHHVP